MEEWRFCGLRDIENLRLRLLGQHVAAHIQDGNPAATKSQPVTKSQPSEDGRSNDCPEEPAIVPTEKEVYSPTASEPVSQATEKPYYTPPTTPVQTNTDTQNNKTPENQNSLAKDGDHKDTRNELSDLAKQFISLSEITFGKRIYMSDMTESYQSCDVDNEESSYTYTNYKTENPSREEILTKFENRSAFAQDLNLLSGLPDLCDIIFLVGEDKQPICGVRAILAARSRVFRKQLTTPVPRRYSVKDNKHMKSDGNPAVTESQPITKSQPSEDGRSNDCPVETPVVVVPTEKEVYSPTVKSYQSCDVDNEESSYTYTNYKTENPSREEILTKFENRSAFAQDLNLLSGEEAHRSDAE
eukprot:sb/3466076/